MLLHAVCSFSIVSSLLQKCWMHSGKDLLTENIQAIFFKSYSPSTICICKTSLIVPCTHCPSFSLWNIVFHSWLESTEYLSNDQINTSEHTYYLSLQVHSLWPMLGSYSSFYKHFSALYSVLAIINRNSGQIYICMSSVIHRIMW